MSRLFCPFPPDFLWGAATAAYQVEGAAAEDGRSPSVWDTFSHTPGATAMDHTGDRSIDHYHRYKQDVALMKELGLAAYRFSISWPRIFPTADGPINPKGIDFYSRLVDELLAAGVQPWATLFHWDLPQWAEDRFRGWESRECALRFGDYAAAIARKLGDRLAGVFTINEFLCFLDKGYGLDNDDLFAPGKKYAIRKTLNQARHHAVLGHGLAAAALRASGLKVGLAENVPGVVPVLETAEHIDAAKRALRALTGMYLTPILEGKYHPDYLEDQEDDAPVFTDEEMKTIATPLDFVGVNLYFPTYVRHDPNDRRGWSVIPCGPDYPRMHMPWLTLGPSILYWVPRLLSEIWKVPAIYVTENGCANPDRPGEDRQTRDTARMMYLQQHLIHAHRATAEGYPLRGYFLWSLMDNFEWTFGYTRRFGIHYVNYQTLERTRKLSAEFYADVIRRNAVGGE
jgi:beta-glucosidase